MMIRIFHLILVISLASCSAKPEPGQNPAAVVAPTPDETVNSDIPDLRITLATGEQISAMDLKGKLAIILFQPDCDHCQREATQIAANIYGFRDFQLYFISSAPMEDVLKFASDYKLKEFQNVHWGTTTVKNVLDTYGPIEAPSLYLYSEKGQLIQSFNGEVAIEVVLKYL